MLQSISQFISILQIEIKLCSSVRKMSGMFVWQSINSLECLILQGQRSCRNTAIFNNCITTHVKVTPFETQHWFNIPAWLSQAISSDQTWSDQGFWTKSNSLQPSSCYRLRGCQLFSVCGWMAGRHALGFVERVGLEGRSATQGSQQQLHAGTHCRAQEAATPVQLLHVGSSQWSFKFICDTALVKQQI